VELGEIAAGSFKITVAGATRGLARGFFSGGGGKDTILELESRGRALSLAAHCLKPTRRRDLPSSLSPAVPGFRRVTSGHVFNIV